MKLDLFIIITIFLDYHQKQSLRLSQYVQVMVPGIQILLRLICAQYKITVCPQIKFLFSINFIICHCIHVIILLKMTVTILVSLPWAAMGNITKNSMVYK